MSLSILSHGIRVSFAYVVLHRKQIQNCQSLSKGLFIILKLSSCKYSHVSLSFINAAALPIHYKFSFSTEENVFLTL